MTQRIERVLICDKIEASDTEWGHRHNPDCFKVIVLNEDSGENEEKNKQNIQIDYSLLDCEKNKHYFLKSYEYDSHIYCVACGKIKRIKTNETTQEQD